MKRLLAIAVSMLLIILAGAHPAAAEPPTKPVNMPDNPYTVISIGHAPYVLAVGGASLGNNAAIAQYPLTQAHPPNDAWFFDNMTADNSSNWFRIINEHSHKCMVVAGASKANYADIIQYDCRGTANEYWFLQTTEQNPGGFPYWVQLRNWNSGKCVAAYGGRTTEGTKMIQFDCNGTLNSQFHLFSY